MGGVIKATDVQFACTATIGGGSITWVETKGDPNGGGGGTTYLVTSRSAEECFRYDNGTNSVSHYSCVSTPKNDWYDSLKGVTLCTSRDASDRSVTLGLPARDAVPCKQTTGQAVQKMLKGREPQMLPESKSTGNNQD